MRFTELFGVVRTDDDDWYDPLLSADTPLFVDPLLLSEDNDPFWIAADVRLILFFNEALKLIARSGGNRLSPHWQKASRMMMFPEPAEFCLGYAFESTRGAGSGEGLGRVMLDNASVAIASGIDSVDHFEELALLGEHVGPDRVSDIACNVLKHEFIQYTGDICRRHEIPMDEVPCAHARWSQEHLRWINERVELPVSPFTGKGILLVPARFLRDLPQLESADFWDWAWANLGEEIRDDFNYQIASQVDRHEITRLARSHTGFIKRYTSYREANPLPPYDVGRDPRGVTSWYDQGLQMALALSVPAPEEESDVCRFAAEMIEAFRQEIVNRGLWKNLWVDGKPLAESYVRRLFGTVVVHYCKANNIDLAPEADAGRGPVDFKFSRGWASRALVEVKLASNSHYWDGVLLQVPQYMSSEEIRCGYLVTIQYRDIDVQRERVQRVHEAVKKISDETGVQYKAAFIDARPTESASRLRRNDAKDEGETE